MSWQQLLMRMSERVSGDVSMFDLSETDSEETTVVIYAGEDAVGDQETSTMRETRMKHTVNAKGRRDYRLVCVGLWCLLLLTINILLYMLYIGMNEEKDSLSQTIVSLSVNFTTERETLYSSIRNLTEERDQLKEKAFWEKFGGSIYYFSNEQKTWSEARQDCRERGADLVTITSKQEQTFISKDKKLNFWIGLSEAETEGMWKWVDGSPLTTAFWKDGEPSNGLWEDCAQFIYFLPTLKTWNDIRCSAELHLMCESTKTPR